MSKRYCCNCGAKDGETAQEYARRRQSIDWQQYGGERFSVHRARYNHLCQFCSQLSEHRHFYDETTGEPKTLV